MADSKMWRGLKPNKAKKVFERHPDLLEPDSIKEFKEKDFRMLVKAVYEVFSKWENIGVCLSIPTDNLADRWRNNAVRGMISILDEWIKGHHGVVALHPCWHSLVYVVADAIGGKNPGAADNIAENWKEYKKNPIFFYPEAQEGDNSPLDVQQRTQIASDLYRDFLHKVEAHWFEIGVLLGVPISELEVLEKNNVNHMIKVIERWISLSLEDDFDYLPSPTLQVLSDAVANKMGGNNAGLAKNLTVYRVAQLQAGSIQNPNPTPPATLQLEQQQQEQQQQQQQPGIFFLWFLIPAVIAIIGIGFYVYIPTPQPPHSQPHLYCKVPHLEDLVGRGENKKELIEAIDFSNATYRVISIVGPPGVGKSTLAIHFANEIAKHADVCYFKLDEFPKDEEITQSKLNLIQWKKNDKERDVRLKEEMSVKWKEMGQNVGISDAVLQGYRGDNIECMDKVITKWKTKGHKKYPATWAGLIKLLKSVELNHLVAMIEEAADDKESTLYD